MLKNYLKIAGRNLVKQRVFSLINLMGLTLGLSAFWLITLYIADELSYDQFQEKADRIYRVVHHASWEGGNFDLAPTSAPFAPALKARFPEIQEAVRLVPEGGGVITYGSKNIKSDDIYFTDKSVFNVFSYSFLHGNPETALANPQAIVLTKKLATTLFGKPEHAINKTIYFENNFSNVVTGVIDNVPPNSHLQFSALRSLPADFTEDWQNFRLYTYLLLNPQADVSKLGAKLPAFAASTIQKEMNVPEYNLELQPLTSIHLHSDLSYETGANGSMGTIYIFTAAAVLILVIALINYMNLTTARSFGRVREVGVRKLLGADRAQLLGLFLAESLMLALVTAFISVFCVEFALPYFNQLAGKELTIWRFGVTFTLLFLIGFSLLMGIFSGSYPAFFLTRFRAVPALKGQMGNLYATVLFRKSLVVFQFVIAVTMIVGTLVIYRQMQYTRNKNLGFNKDQVLTFHIENEAVREQVTAIKTQLRQSSFIQGVAAAGNPIGNNNLGSQGLWFEENGKMATSTRMAQTLMIDADYLPTLDIKLVKGRNFSKTHPSDKQKALLINETLANELNWQDPIGKKVQFTIDNKGTRGERTVIGVVKDFHTYSLQHKVTPMVLTLPQEASMEDNLYVKVKAGYTAEALAHLQKVYRKFDPNNPLDFHFLNENFLAQYQTEQKQEKILQLFTVLAVFIACLGLFGLAAFTAEQRLKEIGIRKVLGATVAGIVLLLSKDFLKPVLVATLIACPIAWYGMHQWLQHFAYRSDITWWIFGAAAGLAIVIALGTVSFHAIKVALTNPATTLRNE